MDLINLEETNLSHYFLKDKLMLIRFIVMDKKQKSTYKTKKDNNQVYIPAADIAS
jgi:hypothetical protein